MTAKRSGRFTASLAFAGLAGLATAPYLLIAAPVVGLARALAIGSVIALAAAVFVMSPDRARGLRYGGLCFVFGVGMYVLAPPIVVLFGSGALLGLLRSSLLYPPKGRIGRALFLETGLFVGATFLARFLAGTTLVSYGIAVWAFFLVESAFFLFEGTRVEQELRSDGDPLERALREASRLMEEPRSTR